MSNKAGLMLGFAVIIAIMVFGIFSNKLGKGLWHLKLSSTARKKIVISALMPPDITGAWHEVIAKFNSLNPDLEVRYIEGPSSTDTREMLYTTSFLAGKSPYDIVFMDIIWVPKFAAAGWLEDLTLRLSPVEWEEFLQGDLEGSKYKEQIYRVPMYSDAGMLYYRKDILDAAGFSPPKTWKELIAIAEKLQDPPRIWGFLWQGKQYEGLSCNFLELIKSSGGFWVDPMTGEVGLDRPEALEALSFMRDLIHKYKISPPGVTTYQEEEGRQLFQSGNAIFLRNWPYVWTLTQEKESQVRGKVGIVPMVHKEGEKSAATQGGWGFGIYKQGKHKEEAWRFISFATSYEIQKFICLKEGQVPTLRILFQDRGILAKNPHYPELYKVLQAATPRPQVANYGRISEILQRYVSASLTGKISTQEALKRADMETRPLTGRVK